MQNVSNTIHKMCIIRPMKNYSELVSSFMRMHRIKRDFLPLCVSWLWCARNLWEPCAIAGLPNITLLGVIQQPDRERWGKGERRDKSLSDTQDTQMHP